MHAQTALSGHTEMTTININGRQFVEKRVLVPISNLQKRVLIPFWTLEWLFEIAVIICVVMVFFYDWPQETDFLNGDIVWYTWMQNGHISAAIMLTAMSVFSLLRIGPVVLYSQQRLTPLGYFFFELPQLLLWPIVWVWSVIAIYDQPDIMPVFVLCGLLQALYLGSTIYACVLLDQYRIARRHVRKSNGNAGTHSRVNRESMLVQHQQQQTAPQRYAMAPIPTDDDNDEEEEVPVSPRLSMLPAYEESQSRPASGYSFLDADVKTKDVKDANVKTGYGYH